MSPRRRWWFLVGGGLVAAALLAVTGPGLWVRLCGDDVRNNALVGQSEGRITAQFGPPVRESEEYTPLGHGRRFPPTEPVRTVVFEPRGPFHLEGGTLWVWLRRSGDDWVCFESCWFADGVRF